MVFSNHNMNGIKYNAAVVFKITLTLSHQYMCHSVIPGDCVCIYRIVYCRNRS